MGAHRGAPLPPGQGGAMRFIEARGFWRMGPGGALELGDCSSDTVPLRPCHWHVNDGPELFVGLDGAADMHYRANGEERVERLTPGRICWCEAGDEHVAHPVPEARILVVERKGSP